MRPKKIAQVVCLAVILLFVISCGSPAQKPSGSKNGNREMHNPSMLESMEKNIEEIFSALNGPTLHPQEAYKTNEKTTGNGSRQDEKNGDQSESGNQKGDQQNQAAKETHQQTEPWNKINASLNDLHKEWNDFMPFAVRLGAQDELMNNFSNSLNELTKQAVSKDIPKTLLTANSVYNYLSEFYSLYRTQKPHAVMKMSYYARNAILNGNLLSNWSDADLDIENLKSTWTMVKNSLIGEEQGLSSKIEFSVRELEKVVNDKNQVLTDIKGRLLLANIRSLYESFDEKKE